MYLLLADFQADSSTSKSRSIADAGLTPLEIVKNKIVEAMICGAEATPAAPRPDSRSSDQGVTRQQQRPTSSSQVSNSVFVAGVFSYTQCDFEKGSLTRHDFHHFVFFMALFMARESYPIHTPANISILKPLSCTCFHVTMPLFMFFSHM